MPRWMMIVVAVCYVLSMFAFVREYRMVESQSWWTEKGRRHAKRQKVIGAVLWTVLLPVVFFANVHWTMAALAWFFALGYCFKGLFFLFFKPKEQAEPADTSSPAAP